MIMSSTRTVDISIHAVSPELSVGVASWARTGSTAIPARTADAAIRRKLPTVIYIASKCVRRLLGSCSRAGGSDGALIGFARADANRMVDRRNEDLAVPDLAR